ncbi:MAG TPA: thioredoxin family protein [Caulifigura sp.]|nr:thioredoxin family protein [Caulifigura sp.]
MANYLLPAEAPTRDEVNGFEGPVLLEFGTAWCGYCRAIAPVVDSLLADFPAVRHIKIEDGSGRPLGRSFFVTLWPTLVFLRDGKVVKQISRPEKKEILAGLEAIAGVP